jgi:hypothetical protein
MGGELGYEDGLESTFGAVSLEAHPPPSLVHQPSALNSAGLPIAEPGMGRQRAFAVDCEFIQVRSSAPRGASILHRA